jgi:hypothetical protein
MLRWIAPAAVAALLALAALCLPLAAQDSDSGGEWERVEPSEPPAPEPGGATQPTVRTPAEVCAGLGRAVAQIATLRDRGVSQEQLMQSAIAQGASGNVQTYVRSYIDYVYEHRDYAPVQIEEQVRASCASHR